MTITVSKFKPDVETFDGPYFFFASSPEQRFLYLSPSVESVLGFSSAEMIGRNYTEFLDVKSPYNADVEQRHQERFQGTHRIRSLRLVLNRYGGKKVIKIQTQGKQLSNGDIIASQGVAEDVTQDYIKQTQANQRLEELTSIESNLSDREHFVLGLVTNGRPNKSIARNLDVTERAVEMIRARLVKKFGVASTAELVSRATELQTLRGLMPQA